MNPFFGMNRDAVFAVYDRAWHNSHAVTFDGRCMQPWFNDAAIRWYVIGSFPSVERLP